MRSIFHISVRFLKEFVFREGAGTNFLNIKMTQNENKDKQALRKLLGLKENEELYTIDEVTNQFEIDLHIAGYVILTRKKDKARGTMKYTGFPRFYYGFIKTSTK